MTYATNESTCVNHPERSAVERCEVCHKPLCAYCLYYTSDGQRLCKDHAEAAGAAGAFIRAPGVYASGLVGAQVTASREQAFIDKLTDKINTPYRGNATDLLALVGMMLGIISLLSCLILPICMFAPVGLILSVLALLGFKDAFDPSRTRFLAGFGLVLSVIWLVAALACGSLYFQTTKSVISNAGIFQLTFAPSNLSTLNAITTAAAPLNFSDTATPVPTYTDTPQTGR